MDVDAWIARLTGKDAKSAYAFAQQIAEESRTSNAWYPCFDRFAALLRHPSSLVRSRAVWSGPTSADIRTACGPCSRRTSRGY